MADALGWHDATLLAEMVRRREVSPLELVDASIARIEKLDGELNAVIHRRFERARDEATGALPEGPFRGVPFLIKDGVCAAAGDPYHAGTRFLKMARWIAPQDSELAARYRRAGLISVGRTNLPEFATAATTEPLSYGATHNPWNLAHSPGGSSGGSAAAVAAGFAPAAHGNDMGGSIRIPAGWNGLVGLKPTRGRVTVGPAHGEYWGPLTHEHVLTRSVRDSARILDAVAGPLRGDPYTAPPPLRPYADELALRPGTLRIGMRTSRLDTGVESAADVVHAVEHAATLLSAAGHDVQSDALSCLDGTEPLTAIGIVVAAWLDREIDQWSERLGRPIELDELEPTTVGLIEVARSLRAKDYVATIQSMNEYSRRATEWSESFDLLLLPTTPWPAPPLGVLGPLVTDDHPIYDRSGAVAFTAPFDITGEPAVSLPLHWTEAGLPVGVQLVAPYGREDLLFRVAAQLEAAQPWSDRHPAVAPW